MNQGSENFYDPSNVTINDLFTERKREKKAERYTQDMRKKSKTRRVRVDASHSSSEESFYDRDKQIIFTVKKPHRKSNDQFDQQRHEHLLRTNSTALDIHDNMANDNLQSRTSNAFSTYLTFNSPVKQDLRMRMNGVHMRPSNASNFNCVVAEEENEMGSIPSKHRADDDYDGFQFRDSRMHINESTDMTSIPQGVVLNHNIEITDEEQEELNDYFNHGEGINLYEEMIRPLVEGEETKQSVFSNNSELMEDSSPARLGKLDSPKKQYNSSTDFKTPSPKPRRSCSMRAKSGRVCYLNEKPVRMSGISAIGSEMSSVDPPYSTNRSVSNAADNE